MVTFNVNYTQTYYFNKGKSIIRYKVYVKIEDYALCHKECDKGTIRNEILKQAIDNFEFIEGFTFTVEVPMSEHVITDNDLNYMDNISELDKQIQEKREQDEFWLKEEQIIKALTQNLYNIIHKLEYHAH